MFALYQHELDTATAFMEFRARQERLPCIITMQHNVGTVEQKETPVGVRSRSGSSEEAPGLERMRADFPRSSS